MSWRTKLIQLDWQIVIPALLLSILGLTVIWNASFYQGDFLNFWKQLIFIVFGAFSMFVFSSIDWRFFRDGPFLIPVLYIVSMIGLIGLLFVPRAQGIRGWYDFGLLSIDPIEFVKLVLVMVLAKYFSTRHVELYRIRHIVISGLYVVLPAVLILMQPELGSVIILALLWFGILLISGIKLKHFLLLSAIGIITLVLSWFFLLQNYHKQRIMSFITPSLAPLEIGWNQAQSKIAIGSGQIFGNGFKGAIQIRYGFLPASQTDFAFAGVVEQWGLVGAMLVFGSFAILLWRVVRICFASQSNFPRIFTAGFVIVIISHALTNIGMNLGLLPVIGIPLPLISYGGSSMLTTFLALGIIQNMRTLP